MLFLNYHFKPDAAINTTTYQHKNLQMQKEYELYRKIAITEGDVTSKNHLTKVCVDHWEMSGKIKVLFNFLNDWAK